MNNNPNNPNQHNNPNVDMQQMTRDAYQAYGDAVAWKNHRGEPMPKFDDLPREIAEAWQTAARKIVDAYGRATTPTTKVPSVPPPGTKPAP
jgi:hypothetical protein